MFIISLRYVVPVEQVEAHMEGHLAWLEKHYASGTFIASGRKVPRTGGIILARGVREGIEACVAQDPFVVNGVADAEIIECAISRAVEGLDALQD
ncbi:YciI family protein [Nitratireductor kimnyeongensis]|uniref:YciI family protein n=1 Tax=Nitratireductor kimnyeongensis TaxID=430679 RepID=A0ABW0T919_9HYPH|nr:YciI family protein [Nitratireductor kimnyeongensis]QZZ36271.1 YciI family protein [Nitratireductor kimnyeongensis]